MYVRLQNLCGGAAIREAAGPTLVKAGALPCRGIAPLLQPLATTEGWQVQFPPRRFWLLWQIWLFVNLEGFRLRKLGQCVQQLNNVHLQIEKHAKHWACCFARHNHFNTAAIDAESQM